MTEPFDPADPIEPLDPADPIAFRQAAIPEGSLATPAPAPPDEGRLPDASGGLPEELTAMPPSLPSGAGAAATLTAGAAAGGEAPGASPSAPAAPEPPDNRSYSDRYRDTAWGDPAPPPGSAPVAAQRRRGRGIFLVLGVVLLAGSVVAGLALATGQLDRALGLGPAPTDTLPQAPRETTDPIAAAAAIDAFLAVVADPKLSYEMQERGTIEAGDITGITVLTGKVAGRDADARFNMTMSTGSSLAGRMIIKGKTVWLQVDGQKTWRKATPKPGEVPIIDAFEGVDGPEDLAYVGREMRRGSLTHHLVTSDGWNPPNAEKALAAVPGLRVDEARMDLWVLDDGRPREAVYSVRASAGGPLTSATATVKATYLFTNVGGKITIKAPK